MLLPLVGFAYFVLIYAIFFSHAATWPSRLRSYLCHSIKSASQEREVWARLVAPRVLITAAANEPEVTISPDYVKTLPPNKQAEIKLYIKMISGWGGMKADAQALGNRLKTMQGKEAYKAKYELIPGVDHGNEPRVPLWDALNFAFSR
jgi:hypothetical protein